MKFSNVRTKQEIFKFNSMKTVKQMFHLVKNISFLCKNVGKSFSPKKLFITNGHIKVKLSGTSRDGIELNETFVADKFEVSDLSYSNSFWINIHNNGKISFNLKRSIDEKMSTRIFINFCMDDDLISEESIQIGICRSLDKNKVLDLALYLEDNDDYPNPNSITNVKFDLKTQIISGDFKFEDNRLSAINISGDFRMKLMQRVM
jgi:hypothetical protein